MIQVSGPESHRSPFKIYTIIAVGFVVITALVAVFSFCLIFSRATVIILSEQKDVESDLSFDIAAQPNDKDIAGNIFQVSKSVSDTFNTSSSVTVNTKLRGRVRITSSLYRDQTLIASTRLLTSDGLLFRIQKTVVVPSFGSVEVEAVADANASVESLPDGTSFTIPGLNEETSKLFKVKSLGEMVGGKKDELTVTEADIIRAEQSLVEKLKQEINATLSEQAVAAAVPITGQQFFYETVNSESSIKAGEEVKSFTVEVTVVGQGIFYDREIFEKQLSKMLADRLPFDQRLARLDSKNEEVSIDKIDLANKRASVHLRAHGTSILSADDSSLDPQQLVNVSVSAAEKYLQSLDGVSSASVKMWPFWAWRLPGSADRIKIEVR